MQRDQSAMLLQYTITTNPSPVNISSDNSPVTAEIDIQVAADPNVLCRYIAVEVPIGEDATDLYEPGPAPTASCDNTDWELSTDFVPGMSNDDGDNSKNFLFKHTNDDMTVDSAVTFSITGTVNKQSGTAPISIREDSSGIDDGVYSIKPMTQNISKMGEEPLYLNAAVICYTDTPEVPVALLDRQRGFQLQWQSNGDSFTIFPGGIGVESINLGAQLYYPVGNGITTDTTYIIQAQKGSEFLYLEYMANVDTPDESFTNLSVNTATDLSQGSTKILNGMQVLARGTDFPNVFYRANTDGFVVASISPVTYADLAIENELTLATIVTGAGAFTTTCRADYLGQTYNSLAIPVKKDEVFSYLSSTPSGGPGMTTTIYWMGLGTGMPTNTAGSESDIQTRNKLKEDIKAMHIKQNQKATDFITAFEEAFDKKLQADTKEQLIKKLL